MTVATNQKILNALAALQEALTTPGTALAAGDLQIGAVELKDATTANRAAISAGGKLSTDDATTATKLDTIIAALATLNAALVTANGHLATISANTA